MSDGEEGPGGFRAEIGWSGHPEMRNAQPAQRDQYGEDECAPQADDLVLEVRSSRRVHDLLQFIDQPLKDLRPAQNTSTGLIAWPFSEACAASLIWSKGNLVMSRSKGNLPALYQPSMRGMNSCGSASPSVMYFTPTPRISMLIMFAGSMA